MARMVATKTVMSIRIVELSDADSKSSVDAASIGFANRAKLESRLSCSRIPQRSHDNDIIQSEKKKGQSWFEMKTEVKQYNTAVDVVRFLPTQRWGAEGLAINAVLDVKEETGRGNEDKRGVKEGMRKRRAEPAAAAAAILNLNQRTVGR